MKTLMEYLKLIDLIMNKYFDILRVYHNNILSELVLVISFKKMEVYFLTLVHTDLTLLILIKKIIIIH